MYSEMVLKDPKLPQKRPPKLIILTGLGTLAQTIDGMVTFAKRYTTQHP